MHTHTLLFIKFCWYSEECCADWVWKFSKFKRHLLKDGDGAWKPIQTALTWFIHNYSNARNGNIHLVCICMYTMCVCMHVSLQIINLREWVKNWNPKELFRPQDTVDHTKIMHKRICWHRSNVYQYNSISFMNSTFFSVDLLTPFINISTWHFSYF